MMKFRALWYYDIKSWIFKQFWYTLTNSVVTMELEGNTTLTWINRPQYNVPVMKLEIALRRLLLFCNHLSSVHEIRLPFRLIYKFLGLMFIHVICKSLLRSVYIYCLRGSYYLPLCWSVGCSWKGRWDNVEKFDEEWRCRCANIS